MTGKVLVKKKGWKAGIAPPPAPPGPLLSCWGTDGCRVMAGCTPGPGACTWLPLLGLGEARGGVQPAPFCTAWGG